MSLLLTELAGLADGSATSLTRHSLPPLVRLKFWQRRRDGFGPRPRRLRLCGRLLRRRLGLHFGVVGFTQRVAPTSAAAAEPSTAAEPTAAAAAGRGGGGVRSRVYYGGGVGGGGRGGFGVGGANGTESIGGRKAKRPIALHLCVRSYRRKERGSV